MAATVDLIRAVYASDIADIRLALSRGADVNSRGYGGDTLMSIAVDNRQTEIVRVLLEAGRYVSEWEANPMMGLWGDNRGEIGRMLKAAYERQELRQTAGLTATAEPTASAQRRKM